MYSQYITTKFISEVDTIRQAIKNDDHCYIDECWINVLLEHFNKQKQSDLRNYITREIIINLIGIKETDVKYGLSISDVLPVFRKIQFTS